MGGFAPIVEVALGRGVFWSIPLRSQRSFARKRNGEDAVYARCWRRSSFSFELDGEQTSVNRRVVDFEAVAQAKVDAQRKRPLRLIWVKPTEADLQ